MIPRNIKRKTPCEQEEKHLRIPRRYIEILSSFLSSMPAYELPYLWWHICADLEARYMKEEKNLPEDFAVSQGYSAPSLEELKAFIRFYINSSNGIINKKPTMKSTLLFAQRFIPGFYCVTGNEIPSNNSHDLYSVRTYTHLNLIKSNYFSGYNKS
jgi:hypothetical protein